MVDHTRSPDRGDIGWLSMNPQQGREQAGRRPAICLSPRAYNEKTGIAIFCPITSKKKGYPFEVSLDGVPEVDGVVLADQVKSLDWRRRQFGFIGTASEKALALVAERITALIGGI